MRLFVAIESSEGIRASIASLLQEFRAIAPQVKWIKPENLHITLKFLGETDANKLDLILDVLQGIHTARPIILNFSGLDYFSNAKRSSILWAGIQPSPNLQRIAQEIDLQMAKLGFPREDRAFSPHLTLARLNKTGLPQKLVVAIEKNSSRAFGNFLANEFHLIESKLKSSGAEYTTVHSFPFVAEA